VTATIVKERGITMSAPSVRAIDAGTKTQTRRVIEPQPKATYGSGTPICVIDSRFHFLVDRSGEGKQYEMADPGIMCRYGIVGDRLWIKEPVIVIGRSTNGFRIRYESDGWERSFLWAEWRGYSVPAEGVHFGRGWPKLLWRRKLEITDIRAQRLEDISEVDARAEGAVLTPCTHPDCQAGGSRCGADSYRSAFANSWNALNAKRGFMWGSRPWVWAISFQLIARVGGES
jgi:hypothetical protein